MFLPQDKANQQRELRIFVDEEGPTNAGESSQAPTTDNETEMSIHVQSDDRVPSMIDAIQQFDTSKSNKELEICNIEMERKIHSFPASVKGIGKRYIRPELVTIGPYHNTTGIKNQEQIVKEMKEAAVRSFALGTLGTINEEESTKKSIETMFEKASSYWHTGDATISGVTTDPTEPEKVDVHSLYDKHRMPTQYDETVDYKLLFTMFCDGCFLFQFIRMCTIADHGLPKWLENWFDVNKPLICKDIMLLENQLPWVVLQTLSYLRPDLEVHLEDFVTKMGRSLQVRKFKAEETYVRPADYKPPHLLGFLWHYKTGHSVEERASDELMKMSKTVSAIELADIGIYLTSSKTTQFKDMGITTTCCTGPAEISLAPLLLDEVTSCWLVNMAAFEVCIATITKNRVVSSYLALLAMLMDGEQDVHELRANRIVQGDLTNKETLDFFKTLVKHIRPDHLFFDIMEKVESYRVRRFIWIRVHRFLYNSTSKRSFKYNYTKTVMTTVTFVGVILAIGKVLIFTKVK
ncbi:unnamed protein product [Alopecurus aequalis]